MLTISTTKKLPLIAALLASNLIMSFNTVADDDLFQTEPQLTQEDVSEQDYEETIALFQKNPKSAAFFDSAYGYAVFPTIGKVGVFIGGAFGTGRMYERGMYSGNLEMTQATIGFQFGGQAYSQIIFFQDQRALDEFVSGNFEFGAQASAVIAHAGANAEASTRGTSATANLGNKELEAEGQYYKGMAVFSAAKGGLMYEASLGGQRYTFTPN